MVNQLNEELKEELAKVNHTYNEELLEVEVDQRGQAETLKTDLEESFSDQVVSMHENQRDLEIQVTRLDDELNLVQSEYNTLKDRYDGVIQKLDSIQVENQRLQSIITENQGQPSLAGLPRLMLDVPTSGMSSKGDDALSISSNDIEFASEKYVNIDYQQIEDVDQDQKLDQQQRDYQDVEVEEPPMSEQLKMLRETLDDAKKDVNNLREEKQRFERLSENLNLELNSLKSELQNQSVFDMSRAAGETSTMKILEASIHELLSASGYNLTAPLFLNRHNSTTDVGGMDESMLPSQYLHGHTSEGDSSDGDDLVNESLKDNTLFHDSIIVGEDDAGDYMTNRVEDAQGAPQEGKPQEGKLQEGETQEGETQAEETYLKEQSLLSQESILQEQSVLEESHLGELSNPQESHRPNPHYSHLLHNQSQVDEQSSNLLEGEVSVFLETPDRNRGNEDAHRLFTKIKFILDQTRDEQNIINNQLQYLKENLVKMTSLGENDIDGMFSLYLFIAPQL